MDIRLTTAGIALLRANTGPVIITEMRLGSAFNYTPSPNDTNIRGSLVYKSKPNQPVINNGNTYLYSIYIDYPVGPFNFGEVGLFTGNGILFALGALSLPLTKKPLTSEWGNSIRLDAYVTANGPNYDIWLNPIVADNQFRVAVIPNVDELPPPIQATPNVYVIQGVDQGPEPGLAYTDRQNLWTFAAYDPVFHAKVVSSENLFVMIETDDYDPQIVPRYFGQMFVQFLGGPSKGLCRNILSVVTSGTLTTINFSTPLAITPNPGDEFEVYRAVVSRLIPDYTLTPATTDTLGGIIVGSGLAITPSGVLTAGVTSVNGKTGNVVIAASDLVGLAKVASTGAYNDLLGKPSLASVALTGKYSDLTGTPNLATVATSGKYQDLTGIPSLAVVATSGKYSDLIGIPSLASVATSGDYNDLINKPPILATLNTTYPNTTTPVEVFRTTALTSAANVDIAICPSGTGAFMLQVPDVQIAGGAKRGPYAVDLQMARALPYQVAFGSYSFAAGVGSNVDMCGFAGGATHTVGQYAAAFGNTNIAGNYGFAVGYQTQAGLYSVACGQSSFAQGRWAFAAGFQAHASGDYSCAIGYKASAESANSFAAGYNARANAANSLALGPNSMVNGITGRSVIGGSNAGVGIAGWSQRAFVSLIGQTATPTPVVVTADGASPSVSNQLVLLPNTAMRVQISAVARSFITASGVSTGDFKGWSGQLLIARTGTAANTTTIIGQNINSTFATDGAASWTLAVAADTVNGALQVTVTGIANAGTVSWNVHLDSYECA